MSKLAFIYTDVGDDGSGGGDNGDAKTRSSGGIYGVGSRLVS